MNKLEEIVGRARLRMPTGRHVEVFREAAAPGQRRRYTKRFLATPEADLRAWTAREARILSHLKGQGVRCVAELIALRDGMMQTFDAGLTLEQWATIVAVERGGHWLPHVFADCAHWWALAHHALRALETLHRSQVVHLEVRPDNLCVPALGADVAEEGSTIGLKFVRLAFIDFAFALSPTEPLAAPLPLGAQPEYAYQSPRLLRALAAGRTGNLRLTQVLDWRCDLYSLGAMLRRYLPGAGTTASTGNDGWTMERHARALALLAALDDAHEREIGADWPHHALMERCEVEMQEPELVGSLLEGFTLAPIAATGSARWSTPPTVIAPLPLDSTRAPWLGVVGPRNGDAARKDVRLHNPGVAATIEPATIVVPSQTAPGARGDIIEPRAGTSPTRAAAASVGDGVAPEERAIPLRDEVRTPPRPPSPPPYRARAVTAAAALAFAAAAALGLHAYESRRDAVITPAVSDSPRTAPIAPDAGEDAPRKTADAASPERGATAVVAAAAPTGSVVETPANASTRAAPSNARSGDDEQPRVAGAIRARPASPSPTAPQQAQATPPPATTRDRSVALGPPPETRTTATRSDDARLGTVPVTAVDEVAARTERDVARVLATAAAATSRAAEQKVVQVARSIPPVGSTRHEATESPALARRLNAEARAAWEHGDVDAALPLQQRAFRANPNDAEVTGNLAFFYLKVRPAQPALARRLALYALAARGQKYPAGRVEDWGTLAVASSLEGREADAIKAMYVMSTVSGNPERACRAARMAVQQYGEAMRAPADAMVARMRETGSVHGAPSCG